jgi:hypothetical protein
MSILVQAVKAVQTFDARRRIPESMRGEHPFSAYAFWTYYSLGDPEDECEYCLRYDGRTFAGNQLRTTFPDLKFEAPDIYPNVHMTLWGKETCKCILIRENPDKLVPESLLFYTGEPTPDLRKKQ